MLQTHEYFNANVCISALINRPVSTTVLF